MARPTGFLDHRLARSPLLLLSLLLLSATTVAGSNFETENGKRQVHHNHAPHTTHATAHSDPLAAWMSSTSSKKPNVLFLIADDLRPKLGCYSHPNMVTPNLDFLASKSILFKQAFAQVALCAPSRTSFLTGRRPDTTRVFDLDTYFRKVSGNFTTLPQYFKNHGYISQAVGKIFHPGMQSSGSNDKLYSWSSATYDGHNPFNVANQLKAAIQPVNETHTGKLQDTNIADFAVNFLRTHAHNHDQPFFLAVGFHKPHLPWIFPQQYLDLYPLSNIHLAQHRTRPAGMPDIAWSSAMEIRKYGDVAAMHTLAPDGIFSDHDQKKIRQGYSAATSYVDAQVGRVMKALSQYGFAGNTIVSFLGDHGWHLGDNAEWCKHTNFDMALRIPMMLYVPGVTSVGHTFDFINALAPGFHNHAHGPGSSHATDELVEAIDLYPTLTELSGLPVPRTCPENSHHVHVCTEGTSLVPLVKKVRGLSHDASISSISSSSHAMQWKQAAFSQYLRNMRTPRLATMGYTVRTKTHRYTEWYPYDTVHFRANFSAVVARELYDHSSDPFEFSNLAEVTSHSGKVQEMSHVLRNGWRKTLENYLHSL